MNIKKWLKTIKNSIDSFNEYDFIGIEQSKKHLKIICERDGLEFFTIVPVTPGNGSAAQNGVIKMVNKAYSARVLQLANR